MKNPAMKSYLSLIPISAKTHRRQNRLILLCIVFAVFLVTTVFSYAEIMEKGMTESMVKKHGNYHIVVSGLSEAEAQAVAGREEVDASAWCNAFGEDTYEGYSINDNRVIMYGAEEDYIDEIRAYEWEGAFPQNDGEVMLNRDARKAWRKCRRQRDPAYAGRGFYFHGDWLLRGRVDFGCRQVRGRDCLCERERAGRNLRRKRD